MTAKWVLTAICFSSGWALLGRWESKLLEISRQVGQNALQNAEYLRIWQNHFLFSLLQIALLMFMFALSVCKPGKRKNKVAP